MKNQGIWYAVGAYILWGIFPIYWKQLHNISSVEMIAHRVVWSFILVCLLLMVYKNWGKFLEAIGRKGMLLYYAIASGLIGLNWLIYVSAVNSNFIIETSLGYFINPLMSVLLGVIILKERLRIWQWVPIILAASGVILTTLAYGKIPWIALGLAFTFGFYGLAKKLAPLNSLFGLTVETGFLFIPSFVYLLILQFSNKAAFLHLGPRIDILIILSGIVTTVPLLLFASATQKISLSHVGFLQYIAPTLQFLIGVFIYQETINKIQLQGFILVWLGLIIFTIEALVYRKQQSQITILS